MRRSLMIASLLIGATTAAQAQNYREPPRAWVSGFGQGIIEAAVRNNRGAELRFACPAGAEDVPPSITLSLPTGGPVEGAENLNAVFEIDGVGHEWSFDRSASEEGSVEYVAEAFNWRVAQDQEALAKAVGQGRTLTVFVPDDEVMQAFSLVGSADALEGCAGD